MRRISRRASFATARIATLVAAIALATAALLAQTESAVYLFVADAESRPILDIAASDLTIKEAGGESTISRVCAGRVADAAHRSRRQRTGHF